MKSKELFTSTFGLYVGLSLCIALVDFVLIQFTPIGAYYRGMRGSAVVLGTIPIALLAGQQIAALAMPFVLLVKARIRPLTPLVPWIVLGTYVVFSVIVGLYASTRRLGTAETITDLFHYPLIGGEAYRYESQRLLVFMTQEGFMAFSLAVGYGLGISLQKFRSPRDRVQDQPFSVKT